MMPRGRPARAAIAAAGLAVAVTAGACDDPFGERASYGPSARITSVSFVRPEQGPCMPCNLLLQVGQAEVLVTGGAGIAYVSDDSTSVLYTAVGGAGGFKGLGESLMRWDVATGRSVRLASEYFVIEQVSPLADGSGRPLFVLSMREFGSGVRHVGIVDPTRGEVFRREHSAVTAVEDSLVVVTEWGVTASWNREALARETGLPMAPPARTFRLPFDSLRAMPVLTNAFTAWDPDAPDAAPYHPSMPNMGTPADTNVFQLGPPPKMPALGSGSVKRVRLRADSGNPEPPASRPPPR